MAVGNAVNGTTGGLPPCPPPDDGGLGVFVEIGGAGVSEGVTPGGSVALGVLVKVGEGVFDGVGVSEGVTPGTSVSVAVAVSVAVEAGVSVAVGKGVNVSVGTGVNVFVAAGGGG